MDNVVAGGREFDTLLSSEIAVAGDVNIGADVANKTRLSMSTANRRVIAFLH